MTFPLLLKLSKKSEELLFSRENLWCNLSEISSLAVFLFSDFYLRLFLRLLSQTLSQTSENDFAKESFGRIHRKPDMMSEYRETEKKVRRMPSEKLHLSLL